MNLWGWHVHNSKILLVYNVCIDHDCIQKIDKHSCPLSPVLVINCIITHYLLMWIKSTHVLVIINCTWWVRHVHLFTSS